MNSTPFKGHRKDFRTNKKTFSSHSSSFGVAPERFVRECAELARRRGLGRGSRACSARRRRRGGVHSSLPSGGRRGLPEAGKAKKLEASGLEHKHSQLGAGAGSSNP